MSERDDQFDDDDDDGQGNQDGFARIKAADLKALRAKAKQADTAEAVLRELAFVKAGIDTDTKIGKLFFAAYDGKLDKEAILKEAADIPGLIPPKEEEGKKPEGDEKPPEGDDQSGQKPTAEELALTKERRDLAGGGKPPTGKNPEDPKDAALKDAQERMKKGASEEDSVAAFVTSVAQAAHAGDERVFVQAP